MGTTVVIASNYCIHEHDDPDLGGKVVCFDNLLSYEIPSNCITIKLY